MISKDTISKLLEKSGCMCSNCGRELTEQTAVIDHIFPRRFGGSDRIENLRVVCNKCNMAKISRFPNEIEFEQYLFNFLNNDSRFENVFADRLIDLPDGTKTKFDLTFSRKSEENKYMYIVEVRVNYSITQKDIFSIINRFQKYKAFYPEARFIYAIPFSLADEYRQLLKRYDVILWDCHTLNLSIPDIALPICAAPDIIDLLIDRLKNCAPGIKHWRVYQKLVGEILTVLFCPPLEQVSEQNADEDYANRRDFVLPNYSIGGNWNYLRDTYKADYIIVDAKNSSEHIKKDDILQVAHYLKEKGPGLFGIIFSRCGVNENTLSHLRTIWRDEDKMLIILDDNDVEQMLLLKQSGNDPTKIILKKIEDFRLKI